MSTSDPEKANRELIPWWRQLLFWQKPSDRPGTAETTDRDSVVIFGLFAALLGCLIILALVLARPAPPSSVTIAAGPKGGGYAGYAEAYARILARDGITLTVRYTNGSVENIGLVSGPSPAVDVALIQSGIGVAQETPELVSLGSLYYEPLWVFVRGAAPPDRLSSLRGLRIAVGPEGSGNRAIALELLQAVGALEGGTQLLEAGGAGAAEALQAGAVDAALIVAPPHVPYLLDLVADPAVQLMSFRRAEAYLSNFRYLSVVEVPEGALDLGRNLPGADITLVSPTATLAARDDLHPAISDLLLLAAREVHGPGKLLEAPGAFPSPRFVDFPLSADAERFFERGPGFWRRFLPFWAANLLDRFVVFAIPLAALGIPLMRLAMPTYRWQVRRRVFKLYRRLNEIEADLRLAEKAGTTLDPVLLEIEKLQQDAAEVTVPAAFANELYHLKMHADLLEKMVIRMQAGTGLSVPLRTTDAQGTRRPPSEEREAQGA